MGLIRKLIILVSLGLIFTIMVLADSSLTADEMMRKMNEHLAISNNFEMMIRVESYTGNRLNGITVMKGVVNNSNLTSLTFIEPLNMKDRKIIKKGTEMWIIIPKVKNPIRITPSQRLVAGITYGDIARINYAEDYQGKLIGEETITGMNAAGNQTEPEKCLLFELVAKDSTKNYRKINFWVNEQKYLPIKADFFAPSGKKMMTANYAAPREWNEKIILTKVFLYDQIQTTKHYVIEYSEIQTTETTDIVQND